MEGDTKRMNGRVYLFFEGEWRRKDIYSKGKLCPSCYKLISDYAKKCKNCKEWNWSEEFDKCQKCGTTELRHWAKGLCRKCYDKKWVKDNPDKVKASREINKEHESAWSKKHYQKYREIILEKNKKYGRGHKEKKRKYDKLYCMKNKRNKAIQCKIYYDNHKKEKYEYDKIYRKKTKDKRNKRKRVRYKTEINFRLIQLIKGRILKALKHNYKCASTIKLIGCSIEYLKDYLESQFDDEMSWGNYGQWHIDHIQPCASFDLTEEEEQRKCFHYTNMQPLWAFDNLSKGYKII